VYAKLRQIWLWALIYRPAESDFITKGRRRGQLDMDMCLARFGDQIEDLQFRH